MGRFCGLQPVEMPHDGKIGLRHRPRQVVDAAAADAKNLGLLGNRQIVTAVDHRFALSNPARRDAQDCAILDLLVREMWMEFGLQSDDLR
jgi:hypothetical protein